MLIGCVTLANSLNLTDPVIYKIKGAISERFRELILYHAGNEGCSGSIVVYEWMETTSVD